MYLYGMRLRGFSIGCQPTNGLLWCRDDKTGRYWDVVAYSRKLSDQETKIYELDYIGEEEA